MYFNYVLGLQERDTAKKVNYREAVRGIIFHHNQLLMVHSNKGDYKVPGGGINVGENYEDTLKREVREETGYIIDDVIEKLGIVAERRVDEYEEDAIFEMISHYYLCKVSDHQVSQQLDDYEKELDFHPIWIDVDQAIQLNEDILNNQFIDKNFWIYREIVVLKALKRKMLTHRVDI